MPTMRDKIYERYKEAMSLSPAQVGPYMSENIARIKRLCKATDDRVARYNLICDECPDTSWGLKMCDTLMGWAEKYCPFERPNHDWAGLRAIVDKIGGGDE